MPSNLPNDAAVTALDAPLLQENSEADPERGTSGGLNVGGSRDKETLERRSPGGSRRVVQAGHRHRRTTSGRTIIGSLGVALISAALVLHYVPGLEAPDVTTADDVCFSGSDLVLPGGLVVDACLTRTAPDVASGCGSPAADAFCTGRNTNYHVNFTLSNISSTAALLPGGEFGTLTLGNGFIGGRLGFSRVCCDVGRYQPAASRILLLVGGAAAGFGAAAAVSSTALHGLEIVTAALGMDVAESLYFLLGIEAPLRWLLFAAALPPWVEFCLWMLWCGPGIDCEAHGSDARASVLSVSQVVLLFAAGAFVAKALPRVISVKYLYDGAFARVRATMRNEALLATLTRPEVKAIVTRSRRRRARGVVGAAAAADDDDGDGDNDGYEQDVGDGDSSRRQQQQQSRPPPSPAAAPHEHKPSSTQLKRFRTFLDHYAAATDEGLAAEAAAQGGLLFDNLVGAWDANADGAVGLHDFYVLFASTTGDNAEEAEADAAAAWALFDLDADGRLTRDEVIEALATIYTDRANTARTVLSNESAVRSLEAAIGFVLYTLLAFAAANILGLAGGSDDDDSSSSSSSRSPLDFFTTYILALSFIFGDTVRSVFRSCLYIFGEQPYGVGDYLDLDGDLWCVEAFDLVYTTLRKWEFNQAAKIPNDTLIDSKMVNVSRGGAFKDTLTISAPLDLPRDIVAAIKAGLTAAADERPKDVLPGSAHAKVDSIDSAQIMVLVLEWVYAFPPSNRQRVDDTREYMVAAARGALLDAGVTNQDLKLAFKIAGTTGNSGKGPGGGKK